MQRQYDFINAYAMSGHTVLAYDRRIPKSRVRRIKRADVKQRVALVGGIVYVDGHNAKGWTFCIKP